MSDHLLNATAAVVQQFCTEGGGGHEAWHTVGCVVGGGAAVVIAGAWVITRFCRPRPAPPVLPTSTPAVVPPAATAYGEAFYGPPAYAPPPAFPYPYPVQHNTYIVEAGTGGDGIGAAIAANAAGSGCNIM